MKIVELDEKKEKEYLKEFYQCFDTGYEFEDFLKIYLEKLNFDEIQITKKSKDGGVDLIAIRNGIGNFSNLDAVHYYIQAKRYKNTKISVKTIRELKGIIPFGHKGMLITTSGFTKEALDESSNDISKPVILVDGKMLLRSCIENEVGFIYEPKFSQNDLKTLLGKDTTNQIKTQEVIEENEYLNQDFIIKEITENDVRARIISVPSKIANLLDDKKEYKIIFEDDHFTSKFVQARNYFSAGFTNVYRKYNLLSKDNIITSKKALWRIEDQTIIIQLKKE